MNRGYRAAPLVEYRTVIQRHAARLHDPAVYEVVVAAYARDNAVLGGWDIAGAAYHHDAAAAASMAVRNLQRTLVETGIRAGVVPMRG